MALHKFRASILNHLTHESQSKAPRGMDAVSALHWGMTNRVPNSALPDICSFCSYK